MIELVNKPNHRPGVDAGWTVLFAFSHVWLRATQAGRCSTVTVWRRNNQNRKGKTMNKMLHAVVLVVFGGAC